jgi:hypothetical protein
MVSNRPAQYLIQHSQTHSYTQLDESKLVFSVTSVTNWGVWKNSLCSEVNRNHTSDCVSIEQTQPMSFSLNKERETIPVRSMHVTLSNVITR